MTDLIACACGLDPAAETMAVQAGAAIALSAPFWFRDRIRHAIRRLRGGSTADRDGAQDPSA